MTTDERDTQVRLVLDGPFGQVTILSGTMLPSEAAATATHYQEGSVIQCVVKSVRLVASRKGLNL